MLPLLVLGIVTVFIGSAAVFLLLTGRSSSGEARLSEITASVPEAAEWREEKPGALSNVADLLKPVTSLLAGNNEVLQKRLVQAGYRSQTAVDIFSTAKLLLPLVVIFVVTFTVSDFVYILLSGALGFFAPDLWLNHAISARRNRIADGLPDVLDLLVVCMEAGLGMDQAVLHIGQEMKATHPDLASELATITREQRAGKPRIDVWRSMEERVDLDIIHQLVSMLAQTEKLGTPIAKSLGQLSESLRTQRVHKVEEVASKTTVKLLFPLVLFIFPSMFIVLLGPAVISLLRSFAENLK